MVTGSADLQGGQTIPEDVFSDLTPEQAARLGLLEREARTLGQELMDPDTPDSTGDGSGGGPPAKNG